MIRPFPRSHLNRSMIKLQSSVTWLSFGIVALANALGMPRTGTPLSGESGNPFSRSCSRVSLLHRNQLLLSTPDLFLPC